ncbi:hypothetical protein HAX54_004006, partial [Datura stramonium]|nr:hypothetical protein [Datura stramonium]
LLVTLQKSLRLDPTVESDKDSKKLHQDLKTTQGMSHSSKERPIATPCCKPPVKPPRNNKPRNDSLDDPTGHHKQSLGGVQ